MEYFRLPETGTPIAFVTHPYVDMDMLKEETERDGLDVEFLEESWYFPGHTIAAVITARG